MKHHIFYITVTAPEDDVALHLEHACAKFNDGFTSGFEGYLNGSLSYWGCEVPISPADQQPYLVKLRVRDGEFETTTVTVVEAASPADAEEKALLGYCHCELGNGAERDEFGVSDCHSQRHYSVQNTVRLDPEEARVLRHLNIRC